MRLEETTWVLVMLDGSQEPQYFDQDQSGAQQVASQLVGGTPPIHPESCVYFYGPPGGAPTVMVRRVPFWMRPPVQISRYPVPEMMRDPLIVLAERVLSKRPTAAQGRPLELGDYKELIQRQLDERGYLGPMQPGSFMNVERREELICELWLELYKLRAAAQQVVAFAAQQPNDFMGRLLAEGMYHALRMLEIPEVPLNAGEWIPVRDRHNGRIGEARQVGATYEVRASATSSHQWRCNPETFMRDYEFIPTPPETGSCRSTHPTVQYCAACLPAELRRRRW